MEADFPTELLIEGALKVSENREADTATWQWRTVQPTALRDYQTYTKVRLARTLTGSLLNIV